MNGKDLYNEMNNIGDDLIEEAINAAPFINKTIPIRIARKRWLALAACLCLIVISIIIMPVLKKGNHILLSDSDLISAKDVAPSDSGGNLYAGGTTKAYFTQAANNLSDLMKSPVKDNSVIPALTVYQAVPTDDLKSCLDEKKQKIQNNVKDNLGLSLTPKDYMYFGDSIISIDLVSDNFRIAMDSRDYYGTTVIDYRIWNPVPPIQNLKLFGEDIVITSDESDESIKNKLSEALAFANKAFGTNCEFQYIKHEIDYTEQGNETIKVYAYVNSDDINQLMYNQYFGNIIFLFMNDNDDKEIRLIGIYYSEYQIEKAFLQATELISVREAESYLDSGYIFAGHVCPFCMSRNADVDFTKYDGIEIVYRTDSFGKYIIPFYAFYKQTGEYTYATAYVPAVAVGDLKEYFEEQEAWHNVEN